MFHGSFDANTATDMTTDIIIICYEKTPALDRCIKSIKEHTRDYNLIAVEGKRSAAENRNMALSKVRSDWFVMMDDDVTVTPGWLTALLECADEDIGQIQPKVLYADGRIFAAEKVFIAPSGENVVVGAEEKDDGRYDYIRAAELLSGTCGLYNKKILKSCSFDVKYRGSQWEDCDFSMQIRKSGFVLLYCGKSTVYHEHLYRSPAKENSLYFKDKWFGKRELTHCGRLYVGLACNLNCLFCFFRYYEKKTFCPLRELKEECNTNRNFYGNTHIDILGGEPTCHPQIIKLLEHCRKIGLAPTVLTNGQNLSKGMVKDLKLAGIDCLTLAFHGDEKDHDYVVNKPGAYKLMREGIDNAREAGITLKVNTVVTRINHAHLPAFSRELVNVKPQGGVYFLVYIPEESWVSHKLPDFYIHHTDAAPHIKEAASILLSAGLSPHICFSPICPYEGFEKYMLNFHQACYQSGWDVKPGHKLRGEFDHLYYNLAESRKRNAQGEPCKKCALRLICIGLSRQYAEEVGWGELRPYEGMLVRDPLYFTTEKVETRLFKGKAKAYVDYLRDNFTGLYPWLAKTDPLILHQITPIEDIKPLLPAGRPAGFSLEPRRILRGALRRAGLLNAAKKSVSVKNRVIAGLRSRDKALRVYREEKRDILCLKRITGAGSEEAKRCFLEIKSENFFNEYIKSCLDYLGRRSVSAIEKPEYIYAICRLLRPDIVLETGVANGISSAHILYALQKSGKGMLYSVDMPDYESKLIATDEDYKRQNLSFAPADLPDGKTCGWAVPEDLRSRWNLKIGLSGEVLKPLLEGLGSIDLFLHDSEHSYKNMLSEFKTAWPYIRQGGLLIAHDIKWNNAFCEFARSVNRDYAVLFPSSLGGGIGIIKK